MKVHLEVTDKQAETWLLRWYTGGLPDWCDGPYDELACALANAIVAARPKPLKVGDKLSVIGMDDSIVLAIQCGSKGMLALCEFPSGTPFVLRVRDTGEGSSWKMADGSQIVWPL